MQKSLVFVAVVLIAGATGQQTLSRDPKLRIVAATSDLAALAREIGGARAEVEALTTGVEDPHSVPGKPSYLLKLRRADLVIVAGLELDAGWVTGRHHILSALSQSGNGRIQPGTPGYFDASQHAEILDVPTPFTVRDIHPLGNPHYWLDPENGRKIAEALFQKLSELRPEDSAYFQGRLREFEQRLSSAEEVWQRELQPYAGRKVVTYRRSWSNFLKRFGLVSAGEIEPSPGIAPSKGHTRELIERIKREGVQLILVEPYFELKTPTSIAEQTGAKVVVLPASVGAEEEITDYFKLFDHDVTTLASAFRR